MLRVFIRQMCRYFPIEKCKGAGGGNMPGNIVAGRRSREVSLRFHFCWKKRKGGEGDEKRNDGESQSFERSRVSPGSHIRGLLSRGRLNARDNYSGAALRQLCSREVSLRPSALSRSSGDLILRIPAMHNLFLVLYLERRYYARR